MVIINENLLIKHIVQKTKKGNMDNISRTKFYERFYFQHPEILWALLAATVSRNAGWYMCDLESKWFKTLLDRDVRRTAFFVYERSNWLIFHDAYPQLLLYHYSKMHNRPLFHLLPYFNVSRFMMKEWQHFWKTKDEKRLLYSLIINEQNLIQSPVISNPFYQKKVFHTLFFRLQEFFHFGVVIFPACDGTLYGTRVDHFTRVDGRIDTGKKLASILFDQAIYGKIIDFVQRTEHSGSRFDYEQYSFKKKRDTPFLRLTYPVVKHYPLKGKRWDEKKRVKKKWYKTPELTEEVDLTRWYRKKRIEIELMAVWKEWKDLNE